MSKILRTPLARQDVIDLADYLAKQENLALARRFKDSLRRTLQFLSNMPGLGIRYEEAGPKYGELRCWPVNGFPNHLIFYRPVANGIEVLRIVHGARNLQRLFDR